MLLWIFLLGWTFVKMSSVYTFILIDEMETTIWLLLNASFSLLFSSLINRRIRSCCEFWCSFSNFIVNIILTEQTNKQKFKFCYLIISDVVNLCKMRYPLNLVNIFTEMNSSDGYINLITSLSEGNLFKHLIWFVAKTHIFSMLPIFFPCQYLIFSFVWF